MAKSKAVFELDVKASFAQLIKDGGKAFETLDATLEKSLTTGFAASTRFAKKNYAELAAYRNSLNANIAKLEKAQQVKIARGGLDHEAYIAKIRAENVKKLGALKDKEDKAEKKALQDAIDANEELCKLSAAQASSAEELNKAIRDTSSGIAEAVKDSKDLAKSFDRAAESSKEIKEAFKGLTDVTKIGSKLEDAGEKFGDALKNGIDVQALTRDLGKGIGKAVSMAGKVASNAMGGGMASTAMLALTGVVAGTVAAFGLLFAAAIAVDKKIKEFNKGLVRTHGALSLAALGGGDLAKGMNVVRDATKNLGSLFGVTQEEATALFDTLDRGGMPLSRLVGGTTDAAVGTQRLEIQVRKMYAAANMMGVGLSEYAENLTNYVDDLAMSADNVNTAFESIAEMAQKSGFSTRRFYSMVVQATSGQASLNTRLEDTGALLMRMSKIMSGKKAAELAGSATNRLGGMSAQDRAKHLIIAGGAGRRVYNREANIQAQNFATAHRGESAGLGRAATSVGMNSRDLVEAFNSAITNPSGLSAILGRLSVDQGRLLTSELRASGTQQDTDMARSLDSLISVSRGAHGGLGARVAGAGELGTGGNMAIMAAEVRQIIGRSGFTEVQNRAAAENVTGLSGDAMNSFITSLESSQADFVTMFRHQNDDVGKRLQSLYSVTLNNGVLTSKTTGAIITSGDDLLQVTTDAAPDPDTAMSLAQETMDATVSVADILENNIANLLQEIGSWLGDGILPMLRAIPGLGGAASTSERNSELSKLFGAEIKKVAAQSKTRATSMDEQRKILRKESSTGVQKANASRELKRLEDEQTTANARRTALQQGRSDALSGGIEMSAAQTRFRAEVGGMDYSGDSMTGDHQNVSQRSYATEAEARAAAGAGGTVTRDETRHQLSAQERMDIVMRSAAIRDPSITGAAPAPAITAPTPSTPTTTTPTTAATAPAVAIVPPTTSAAATTAAPTVDATTEAATDQNRRDVASLRVQKKSQEQLAKLAKGKEFGDGLATSKLPDAIAMADSKMRLLEAIYTAPGGLDSAGIQRVVSGEGTGDDIGRLSPGAQAMIKARSLPAVRDFVYQDSGGRSMITPISSEDQVVGMKPGGPIANAGSRSGGNVNITINGGDEQKVFAVVKRAIQQAGITPNRVPGAT